MSENTNQVSDTIEQLAYLYDLHVCVQCGKCAAVCPMGQIFDDFSYEASPRGIIERILLDFEIPEGDHLWFCLTCDLCTDLCPAGVSFREFVEASRQLVINVGVTEYGSFCRSCGAYLWPNHTAMYLKQILGDSTEEFLTLCASCRQYNFGRKVKALRAGERKISVSDGRKGENQ